MPKLTQQQNIDEPSGVVACHGRTTFVDCLLPNRGRTEKSSLSCYVGGIFLLVPRRCLWFEREADQPIPSLSYCVAAYSSIPSNSTRVLFYAHFSIESIIVETTMSSVRRSTRARKEVVDPYQNELNLLASKKVAAKR
jgi:hypothetical protein